MYDIARMIIGQSGGMIGAHNFSGITSHKITVQTSNYDISADVAASFLGVHKDPIHNAWLGISEIDSAKGKEIFAGNGNGIYTSIIFRKDTKSVTFGAVGANCRVTGRYIINYWK